jgi:two-component system response regulator AtoC
MRGRGGEKAVQGAPTTVLSLQQASERAEIEAIRAALQASEGRRTVAAERLGISRKTLWEKIKNYGISLDS